MLSLSLGSCFWVWDFVNHFDDPSGSNGYFYLKQTEALAGGLGFYFKDYSLAFLLPVTLMKILGDSLTAYRVSTIGVWFALTVGVGLLTRNLLSDQSPRIKNILPVAAVLALVSTTQLYDLSLTFFKNTFALNLIIWALFFATSSRPRDWKWAWVGVLTLAALLSHKSVLLMIACFGIPFLFQQVSKKKLAIATGCMSLTVGLFLWHFDKAYAHFLAMLNYFSPPTRWWFWMLRLRWINLELLMTFFCLLIILLLGIWTYRKVSSEKKFYVAGAVVFLCFALHPFQIPGPNGPSYRLLLIAPVFGIPLLMLALSHIPRGLFALPIFLVAFVSQIFIHVHPIDDVFTPFAVIKEEVLRIKEFVEPQDHLTSHHGLEFFIDYTTGIRSRSFLSDYPEQKAFRVAYLARSWIRKNEVQVAARQQALLEIGSEYLLFKEIDWQEFKARFKIPRHWKNPEVHRPNFISE
ncbi:MAG: hypothetical protein V4596_01745 [Bdellovibrionota bacterium]